MPAAALPANEHSRLAMLEALGILDTPAEADYDDIVAIAAAVCGTPSAVISLVDADRQWFKARLGCKDAQTSRDLSFCAHAILAPDETMVVPDARLDARFADNPMVAADDGVRFYAGAPLLAGGDMPVGTVCVFDTQPRTLTPTQIDALGALSRQASRLIEMRRLARLLSRQLREREWYEQEMKQYQTVLETRAADLSQMARVDPLTGLPNRRSFFAMLKTALNEPAATNPVQVAVVDIDNRQTLEELHGPGDTDRMLSDLGASLRAGPRIEGTVARVGDEFALLLEQPAAQAAAQCELLRQAIAEHPGAVPLTVSIGLASARAGEDAAELFVRAEKALRDAQAAGGNRVQRAA